MRWTPLHILARILLTLAIGVLCLPIASASDGGLLTSNPGRADATGHRAKRVDKVLPKIVVASPGATTYRLGQSVLLKFSCTAPSGIASCRATLSRAGEKAGNVVSGKGMRLSGTGRYVLRITAKDRRGNSASKTLSFYVVRTISWSGYTWTARLPGAGLPGPNAWSDSPANIRVRGTDLLLSIVKDASGHWTSAELDNQRHLGYGTYRWVVASDLRATDANDVLGMFTYSGPAPLVNEIDIEASRWGNVSSPTGQTVVRKSTDSGVHPLRAFEYSNRPPYVNQFTWAPGRVSFLVTDATGATLLSWTATIGVPTPSTEVPIINHWRVKDVAPARESTIRISSFAWVPPGRSLPPASFAR